MNNQNESKVSNLSAFKAYKNKGFDKIESGWAWDHVIYFLEVTVA